MRCTKFLGFAAGVMLAASSTVVAQTGTQTGPTFPTNPPVTVGSSAGDITAGSGSSIDPRNPVDPRKPRSGTPNGMDVILPGTDPAAGR
jgi:hypothetical protein